MYNIASYPTLRVLGPNWRFIIYIWLPHFPPAFPRVLDVIIVYIKILKQVSDNKAIIENYILLHAFAL